MARCRRPTTLGFEVMLVVVLLFVGSCVPATPGLEDLPGVYQALGAGTPALTLHADQTFECSSLPCFGASWEAEGRWRVDSRSVHFENISVSIPTVEFPSTMRIVEGDHGDLGLVQPGETLEVWWR